MSLMLVGVCVYTVAAGLDYFDTFEIVEWIHCFPTVPTFQQIEYQIKDPKDYECGMFFLKEF